MNPKETPELTVQALMALRQESDALRVITDRLRVKEMGPADHIRTKHEVKAFLESTASASDAQAIIARARARRDLQQTQGVAQKLAESRKRGQTMQQ